jgi:hypothetical protein
MSEEKRTEEGEIGRRKRKDLGEGRNRQSLWKRKKCSSHAFM